MSKYQEFQNRFQESGLTQKAFREREGISSSLVWYYLNKAREEQEANQTSGTFHEVEIQEVDSSYIEINTSSGIQIKIPI